MTNKLTKYLSRTETNHNGCMQWQGCFNTDGYPRVAYKGNLNGKLHRIVYELTTGEDIQGKVVRHTCDNIKCINPDHLLSGTPADNMRDRDSRFRHGAAKLSPSQVVEIRQRIHENPSIKTRDLAKEYNIAWRTMHSLRNGKHWKQLIV